MRPRSYATAQSKPAHLGPLYGAQFEDESIARAYQTRPPYPPSLFAQLADLMVSPGPVLDLGCGTGDIALGLIDRVEHIDAVDPSAAMLRVARSRRGADRPGLRWIHASAETFSPTAAYALAVAGESFHWMDWPIVCGWLAPALLPDARLALVTERSFSGLPPSEGLGGVIARYSTNREYRPYDLVAELTSRGLFDEEGRSVTPPQPFAQSIDDYIESWHTRNGLSRERMPAADAVAFDAAIRDLVTQHCIGGEVRGTVTAAVVWGRPRPR